MFLAVFCLRLAFGLLASLLFLLPFPINPRFFRTHFLTALALALAAVLLLHEMATLALWIALLASVLVCFSGSMSWHLENAPGGRSLIVAASFLTGLALALLSWQRGSSAPLIYLADDFTSAAFLGLAMTAMLLGHSYLIAPTMSIKPLQRLLAVLGVGLVLRIIIALVGLWSWSAGTVHENLETETILWLSARWIVGFLVPMVLGWMAWETSRIRSTQSATGILYVVVICVFLGELTSLLLFDKIHSFLQG